MDAKDLTIEQIKVGDAVSFSRAFTKIDVDTFAQLSGDTNPLHTDESYAATTPFGQPLVHGMLAGSLASTLVGMHLPGKRCLYLSQTLTFKLPVYIGDMLTVSGKVISKSVVTGILEIAIVMKKGDIVVIEGTATVQVRPDNS